MVFRKKLRQHKQQGFAALSATSGSSSHIPTSPCGFRTNLDCLQPVQQIVSVGGKLELPDKRSSFSLGKGKPIQIVSSTGEKDQD